MCVCVCVSVCTCVCPCVCCIVVVVVVCCQCCTISCVNLCRETFDPSAVFASVEEVSGRSQQTVRAMRQPLVVWMKPFVVSFHHPSSSASPLSLLYAFSIPPSFTVCLSPPALLCILPPHMCLLVCLTASVLPSPGGGGLQRKG